MAKLKISYLNKSIANSLAVKVYLDNCLLERINDDECYEFDILPGKHEIYVSSLCFKSQRLSFKVEKENRQFEILSHPIELSLINDCIFKHQDVITLRQRMV